MCLIIAVCRISSEQLIRSQIRPPLLFVSVNEVMGVQAWTVVKVMHLKMLSESTERGVGVGVGVIEGWQQHVQLSPDWWKAACVWKGADGDDLSDALVI